MRLVSSPADSPGVRPRGGNGTEESAQERLRRLEAITDVTLSVLDVDDLVPELLERVRDVLWSDTVAILLADPTRKYLVATYARGIEEEVLQGSRVPIGRGFAGQIAATREAVILHDVTPATVVNPVLLLKGVRSMLGVPLVAEDEMLGVMHVGTLRRREYTAADISLLQQAADRAALAISAARARHEAAAATLLQDELSPPQLGSFPGLDLAARYVPGQQMGVGGDWYDAFRLPHGKVALVIGDVMGHGLRAAVSMVMLRSAVRAYAVISDGPKTMLERLDNMLLDFDFEETATVLYGMYNTVSGELELGCAGHIPPIITQPGRPPEFADVPADPLLGTPPPHLERRSADLTLTPGGSAYLFTDGLVERRNQDLDAQMDRLFEVLNQDFDSPNTACAAVMASLVGDQPAEDDIALLALTRTGHGPHPGED